MVRVKLDQEILGLSSLLERFTHARVKDCFKGNDTVYFIVAPGEMGKALGKGGSHIRKVQNKLGTKVKVIEYNDNVVDFVKNIIYPLHVDEITEEIMEEGIVVVIKDRQRKVKSLLVGREGRNLEVIKRAVRRFFDVDVKVV